MGKYIIIKFRNAKLFRNKKTKDKVFDDHERQRDRKDIPWFKEPITVHQVSNMLHVLFGERPIPTVRDVVLHYGRNENIFNLAQDSLLRIDSLQVKNAKGEPELIQETTRLSKAVGNSWNPQSYPLHWERVRKYMGAQFDEFVQHIEALLGPNQSKRPFKEVLDELHERKNESGVKQLIQYLKDSKRMPMVQSIETSIPSPEFNKVVGRTAVTVTSGVDKVSFLSGEILVPTNDEWLDRIRKYGGNPTILDGGMVWIHDVADEDDLSPSGFRKMSDISLETY